MDAKPRRCAGLSDLGLSVSAWPKLASKGSQRLVSVGRAQAAAAMVLSCRALALCSAEGISSVGRRPWAGGGLQGSDASSETSLAPRVVPLAAVRTPAAAKPSSLVWLSLALNFRAAINVSFAVQISALGRAGRAILSLAAKTRLDTR